jgi:ubiquitin-protein ligase
MLGCVRTCWLQRFQPVVGAPEAQASVFLAVDEERMDVCRAVITGPVDTPYAFGAFVFDIFFPDEYPQVPPLIKLTTTGAGTVRAGDEI